jgi:hypothetical protein
VIEEYEDPSEAQARLFEVERDLQRDPDRGVVLLFGDSTEALRRTHGSYFKKIEELLETVEG